MLQPLAICAVSQRPGVHRNTPNTMPQTEEVTPGFDLRHDPNSDQSYLYLATESQVSVSSAPDIIWNSSEVVMNYVLVSQAHPPTCF